MKIHPANLSFLSRQYKNTALRATMRVFGGVNMFYFHDRSIARAENIDGNKPAPEFSVIINFFVDQPAPAARLLPAEDNFNVSLEMIDEPFFIMIVLMQRSESRVIEFIPFPIVFK